MKKLQEILDKDKQEMQEKDKSLEQSISKTESLKQQLKLVNDSLMEGKQLIRGQLIFELKKLKDYFVQVEDERELANVVLYNVASFQRSMGDKPLKSYHASSYLNLRTKAQLMFAGIHDRAKIISQAKKYTIKYQMVKNLISKENFMIRRVSYFKEIFKDFLLLGFPNVWNQEGICFPKNDYHLMLLTKKNDISIINKSGSNIKGEEILKVMEKDLFLIYETKKVIVGLPLVSYTFYSELDAVNIEMLAISFPSTSVWKRISMFVDKWNVP